ncbi:hypothetical protein [uncultured Jatrophihabitans sp.]|uniref:hypothetical protein n=1 Tax=uncultured Jatrophihabitans sp. TaxID=1610747 RepID=UPI0035CA9570
MQPAPPHPGPSAPVRTAGSRLGLIGAALVVIGLVLCLAYRYTAPGEPHSYAAGAVAPYEVSVTQGHLYHVAVHRGVDAEADRGRTSSSLTCTYSVQPGVDRALPVTAESDSTKATNVIATFQAPVTGSVHIACAPFGSVFVDDADNAPGDRAGLYLLLGIIALGLGVPLLLSGVRSAFRAREDSAFRAREDSAFRAREDSAFDDGAPDAQDT